MKALITNHDSINGILLLGICLLTFLFFFPEQASMIEHYRFWGLMLLFGVTHGVSDRQKLTNRQSWIAYILFILLTLLAWLVVPWVALLTFVALAAYHFGQEHRESYQLSRQNVVSGHVVSLATFLWGCAVIALLILLDRSASYTILSSYFSGLTLMAVNGDSYYDSFIIYSIYTAAFFLVISFLLLIKSLSWRILLKEIGLIALIVLITMLGGLYWGFGFYFGLSHSIKHITNHTNKKLSRKSYRHFIATYKYVALATVSLFVVWMGSMYYLYPSVHYMLAFFILLSALTLPHCLLEEYEHRRVKK